MEKFEKMKKFLENEKVYSDNYFAKKAREYNEDPFKYAIFKIRAAAYQSRKYHNEEEVRAKKKEYNRLYWIKKQEMKNEK